MARNPERAAKSETRYGVRGRVIFGLVLTGLLATGIFGWAARSELAGAVVVAGEVSVDRDLRVVQHLDGGIVEAIFVEPGDHVKRGDVLIRLDSTRARSERDILHGKLAEYTIRKSRLEAQRDLRDSFSVPPQLDELMISPEKLREIYEGERRIFEGNLQSYLSRREQLELGIRQIGSEIDGLLARLDAKESEIQLVSEEGSRIETLSDRRLIAQNAVYSINREKARLQGERGQVLSEIGRARSRISELELEILTIEKATRTDAQRELGEVETRLSELTERREVVENTLSRTDIRAPISGRVNVVNVNSVDGVIAPGEVLATIVPEGAALVFTGRVPAIQIERVELGRTTRLRFSAFDQNETPEIEGEVTYVSAASTKDQNAPGEFYSVKVSVTPEELGRLEDKELRPGMPVELYITTSARTALSYLVKPIKDQIARGFRER